MDIVTAHRLATRQFDLRMQSIRDGQWDNRTPCAEWTVRDLVNHLVYEQLWVPDLIAGKTIAEVGDAYEGDVLGDDPLDAWQRASAAALAAVAEPDAMERTVHLSFGECPADEYVDQLAIDLAVHAWDLARGIGADDTVPNDLGTVIVDLVREHQDELTGSGMFGEPQGITACTDDFTEALARLGRRPWKRFDPKSGYVDSLIDI